MGETKHTVLIDEKLYQDIKEYCQYNNLKTGEFINNMLKEKFMSEKYGDSPFDEFRKKIEENTVEIDPQIQQAIADNFWEMLDDEKTDNVKEEAKTEVIKMDEPKKEIIEKPKDELPKITTIPEQEKPKKRRLK